jgi:hypothetical protein
MTAPPTLSPRAQRYVLDTRDGTHEFHGRLLGSGTSDDGYRERWFEVSIYQPDAGGYLVHTLGKSRVPGERTFIRLVETTSAFEIVELLTVHHNDKTYIPRQSARALAQAAMWDEDIRDAYINRVV